VADEQDRRVEIAKPPRRLDDHGAVLGSHRGERERLQSMVGDLGAPVAGERVAGQERPVARVQERHVPGSVTGRRDHLEAADALAPRQADVRPGRERRPRSAPLALDDPLAGAFAGVEVAQEDVDCGPEPCVERIERPGVIQVPVRQRDAPDLATGALGDRQQRVGGPAETGVDERESVFLAHEERVHEPGSRQLQYVWGYLSDLHLLSLSSIVISLIRLG
jgi:hypothetical protein